ncbi:MAG: potassium channel family protein [Haloferacaceae archaeon]
MASLPIEILFGIYLGLLTGIIPALVAWTLGFIFRYFTGVSIAGFAVVVLAVAIAGVNGGLLALADPTILRTGQERLIVALLVVLMLALYAHAKGDQMGAEFPRRISLKKLRERTLSTDVVELVGGRGQVRVHVVGDVDDIEGYPPLSADLRAGIRRGEWTFPADVPLVELETRVTDRIRTEFDLAEVSVTLDERARATVRAAPPAGSVSKRVPAGERAVSLSGLIPTGLARGDEVTVHAGSGAVAGTVVSAGTTAPAATRRVEAHPEDGQADGGEDEAGDETPPEAVPAAPVTTGGEGRLTVSASRAEAERLLQVGDAKFVVRSRGTHREYELVALLQRAGKRFRKFTVGADSDLADASLRDAAVRDTYDVVVLGVRHGGDWSLAPRGATRLAAGDELFATGASSALASFEEAVR